MHINNLQERSLSVDLATKYANNHKSRIHGSGKEGVSKGC